MEKEKNKLAVPYLSEQYYKSRKQPLLWSSILFAWEFIGIDLKKMKEVT